LIACGPICELGGGGRSWEAMIGVGRAKQNLNVVDRSLGKGKSEVSSECGVRVVAIKFLCLVFVILGGEDKAVSRGVGKSFALLQFFVRSAGCRKLHLTPVESGAEPWTPLIRNLKHF